jgi:hypothetical protein
MSARLIITADDAAEDAWQAPLPAELLALLCGEAARLDASVAKTLGPTPTGEPRVTAAVLAVELVRAALTHQVRVDEGAEPGRGA